MSRKTHLPETKVEPKQRRILRREAKLKAACPTGKRRYKDEASALVALERIQRTDDPRRTKTPQRTYDCPYCAGWHLSSTSRQKPLPRRSKKMQGTYRKARIPLVVELLAARPWCEIRWDDGCTGRATEVDEIVGRGRGGDFLDPSNCQTACHYCHRMKTEHPAEARRRGFEKHSWEGEAS